MKNEDRTIAPAITNEYKYHFLKPESLLLNNGIKVHFVSGASQEVLRIEIIYDAGNVFENKNLVSTLTNELLGEGTSTHSASQINEKLDYYGSYLSKESGRDQASISLYTLNKNLENVFPVLLEVINESIYPDHEFEIHLKNKKASFLDGLKKTDFVCRNYFPQLLFGKHKYGAYIETEDFSHVDRDDLNKFYQRYYLQSAPQIFVSGYIDDKTKSYLIKYLESINTLSSSSTTPEVPEYKSEKKKIKLEGAIQSAIRIGKPVINIDHPEYPVLAVLNTILGGYFGSRLMKNIREEKGFTYGIGSGISAFNKAAMFFITTEVGKEVTDLALSEIYKEIELLQKQPVSDDELNTVKNYMLGNFLKSLDGPFAQCDKIKTQIIRNLNENYYKNYIESVRKVDSIALHACAIKYFDINSLSELVVGDY